MRKWLGRLAPFLILIVIGVVVGRQHQPDFNQPLEGDRSASVQDFRPTDDTFVWVAFSGGGTRAAAMAWEVLEELREIEIDVVRDGKRVNSNIADEIDYISGISGGSFAAVGWTLFRDDPDVFRTRFLERNIERALTNEIVTSLWRPFALASPLYSRINVAAEYYDRKVFDEVTFSDLPARPALRIHATDLALGGRFTFSEEDFRKIGSDLFSYPVAYACAASSAFPILLSPISLRNFGETVPVEELRLQDYEYDRYVLNSRRNVLADLSRIGREHYNDKTNSYIHLADGGIVDNQGLGALLDEFETGRIISQRLADSTIPLRRLILINVNAGVSPDNNVARRRESPGVSTVVLHTMVASMDILSARRWMRIKEFVQQLNKAVIDVDPVAGLRDLEKPYAIEVSFRNLTDEGLRARSNALPTSFKLDQEELDLIAEVVPILVAEDPEMVRLKRSIGL